VTEIVEHTCTDCGEPYLSHDYHVRKSERHRAWKARELGPEVPVPPQPSGAAFRDGVLPKRIVFGELAVCPSCHGKRTPQRLKPNGQPMAFKECRRCNGAGYIPNQGPVTSNWKSEA
jgi:Zn ribbon nucleic-acid-binding protein